MIKRPSKELQELWDHRLKQSGFKDIERTVGNKKVLSQRATNAYRQASQVERESKAEYYSLLSYYASHEKFDDPVDRLIMERRSVGTKISDICKELKGLGKICYKATIRYRIRKYETQWGIRIWKPHQMRSFRIKK